MKGAGPQSGLERGPRQQTAWSECWNAAFSPRERGEISYPLRASDRRAEYAECDIVNFIHSFNKLLHHVPGIDLDAGDTVTDGFLFLQSLLSGSRSRQ